MINPVLYRLTGEGSAVLISQATELSWTSSIRKWSRKETVIHFSLRLLVNPHVVNLMSCRLR